MAEESECLHQGLSLLPPRKRTRGPFRVHLPSAPVAKAGQGQLQEARRRAGPLGLFNSEQDGGSGAHASKEGRRSESESTSGFVRSFMAAVTAGRRSDAQEALADFLRSTSEDPAKTLQEAKADELPEAWASNLVVGLCETGGIARARLKSALATIMLPQVGNLEEPASPEKWSALESLSGRWEEGLVEGILEPCLVQPEMTEATSSLIARAGRELLSEECRSRLANAASGIDELAEGHFLAAQGLAEAGIPDESAKPLLRKACQSARNLQGSVRAARAFLKLVEMNAGAAREMKVELLAAANDIGTSLRRSLRARVNAL